MNTPSDTLSPLTEDEILGLTTGLTALAPVFAKMQALKPKQRQRMVTMGARSEGFCRELLTLLDTNRQLVPPSLALDSALAELRKSALMDVALLQLSQMYRCALDAHAEMRAKVMATALDGYKMLKASRRTGLEDRVRDLSNRFDRSNSVAAKRKAAKRAAALETARADPAPAVDLETVRQQTD